MHLSICNRLSSVRLIAGTAQYAEPSLTAAR
jgi:hypothetical protein